MTWNFDTIKQILSEMVASNYADWVKAFVSLELNMADQTILNQVYQDYMAEDATPLISDEISIKAVGYHNQVKEDVTDILEKLYRTGEGSSFIMEVMSSGDIEASMETDVLLNSEDYDSLSLACLQEIIQQDLAITSNDYFGDLTYLALKKDYLDQKSQFLQDYVSGLLASTHPEKGQRDLVLD